MFKSLYNLIINHIDQCETLFPNFSNQSLLKKVLEVTYSPFYRKKIYNYSSIIPSISLKNSNYRLFSLLRSIESNDEKNILCILTQSTIPELELYRSILSGTFKNLPVQLVNKIFPNLIVVPINFNDPILKSFLPEDLTFPIVMEPYIDGYKINIRIVNNTMVVYTHDFKDITSKFKNFIEEFPKDISNFNCTIVPHKSARFLASVLNSEYDVFIFDSDYEGNFLERKRKLSDIFEKNDKVKLSPFIEVNSYEDLIIYYNNFINKNLKNLLLINPLNEFNKNVPYLISSLFTNFGIILHKIGMEEKNLVVTVSGKEILIKKFSDTAKNILYSKNNLIGFKCLLEYTEHDIICTQIFNDAI